MTVMLRWAQHSYTEGGSLDDELDNIAQTNAQTVRQHVDEGLLVINLLALVIGGVLSYWFAGLALEPIEEAHETQARFTADASHEMRTPLANMRLENEVFLRQKSFTEEDARFQLASNLEEVQRLERLSNNLLMLHQYGQDALTRSPIKIQAVVKDTLHQLAVAVSIRKVKIKTEVAPAQVMGHSDSLVQLTSILLDNALKYGGQGGTVRLHGRIRGKKYLLAVEDKGPGIAPKDLPHIFERLYRGDKARSTRVTGYGLGLALAKEIVQANRGSITARNLSTGGASFEIQLDLVPVKPPAK